MLSELSLTIARFGFLIVLWALVLSAISVLRADIYGTRVTQRGRGLSKPKPTKPVAPEREGTGVRRREREPKFDLVVTAGPLRGTVIPMSGVVSIGRAPTSTVVIDDDYCSARHARVFAEGGQWLVEDLGSTNGTYLDDESVEDPVEVGVGSIIRLGSTTLEMREA